MSEKERTLVSVVMGSQSDWDTMRHAHETLKTFGVIHECRVISAHRTPDLATEYAKGAAERGVRVIIAGAGGAAHLAGVVAAHTLLPVLGVPMMGWALNGLDALLAVRILALEDGALREKLRRFHDEETRKIMKIELPLGD